MNVSGQVCLRRGEESRVRGGAPWIFENELDWADDTCETGGIVDVLDSRLRFCARGFWNPGSKICVRVLTRDQNETIDRAFFRRRLRSGQHSAFGSHGPLCPVVGSTGGKAFFGQGIDKNVLHFVLAVHHEHALGLGRKGIHPAQQALPVCMAGHAGKLADLRLHLDGFTEQLDLRSSIDQGAAQRAHRLIAHEQNGALRPPQVVLEVVADAARVAHAGGGDDDLGGLVHVEQLGLLAGGGHAQAGEGEQPLAALDQLDGLLVEVAVKRRASVSVVKMSVRKDKRYRFIGNTSYDAF